MTAAKQPTFLIAAALSAAFAVALFSAPPAAAAPKCDGTQCSCTGDTECNDMYSNYCGEDRSKDQCVNDTCTCVQRASNAGITRKPVKGVAQPIQSGQPAKNK